MARIRRLAHAPITEAIFDFRIALPPAFEVTTFDPLRARLADRYPTVQERRSFEARFAFKEGKPAQPETRGGLDGYVFRSADNLSAAQFRLDGFTYNRLAPYTSWDQLMPEALALWDTYVETTRPEAVTRVAVRYVNRLRIPAAGGLSKYLVVLPPRFPGTPQHLAAYLMRVSSHDPESAYHANITHALEPKPGTAEASVILDIDVYTVSDLDLESRTLAPILETMRTIKNEVFFGTITEEMARQYE
jgi:uncharacterized protein (TIGR04255 family)